MEIFILFIFVHKLFEGKINEQGSVFPQFSSSDQLELVGKKFLSGMEPGFFAVKKHENVKCPGYTEGRLMSDPWDSNVSKCSIDA